MSQDILPVFDQIRSAVSSAKQQQQEPLTGASRVRALERELEQLDAITASIDNVIESVEVTSSNLDVTLATTESTNKLLDTWIKILSQTTYTTNLLNDNSWRGLAKNEEVYQEQLKRFEELNKRYTAEKQKKEQEKEVQRLKRLAQEQRVQEREEALKRRVYGRGARPVSSQPRASSRGPPSSRGVPTRK